MPFDIQEYYNKHKDYYGDVPLDAVAKDIYDRGYSDKFGDFGEFKKAAGIHDTILADSNRRKGPSSVSPLGLGKSFVKGAAEGLTTELPSMVGKSLQFVGPSGGKIEHAGKSIADWAEEKREAWYGPEEERSGLDRIVYEGAKMFAPSVIPGGIAGTAARGALRVGSIAAKAKTAADVAQKTALMAEATRKAGIAVNIGSGAAAGLFGLSQAQETRDTALERADQLEAEGKTKEAQEMRKKAYGVAPLATGAVEALGEFLGTKYLAKLFRLDESVIAKMGTKEFAINLLKTMGVEVGTEIGQEGSQAFIEKHTGIRPEANPLQEAMDVIGPTVFLTLLTGGLAGAANKMRSDDKSEREGAQELERLKQGAVLTMTIHDGLKTGQHQGRPFTADDASKLMKMGQAAGFYTKDDIERFHEQYPVLKPAANELLVEDVKKKVTEALFNEKGQPLLPPGQGFTFRDVDYGIPVGEPYGGEDILRPTITRAPEEAIDAEFETIRQLPAVRRDETLALPPGQGFTLIETPPAKEVDYQAEAEKYGVKYNGIQKGHKDIPDMPMFTADIDGVQTTFVLNQGETLPQAIERKRLQKEEYDARETKKGPIDVESGASPVAEVPVGQIKISKDVKQFKEGADEAGIVAGQEIKGEEYRRTPYNPIVLWRRNNGDLEVVTGRHRLEFAKRIGEETIPAQILNESDGFTAQDALTFDAEQNILDNQGTERDYANYFRNTEIDETTARERGLLRGKKAASAFLLGKDATDQTFNAFFRHKDIGFRQAVAIARAAPGDERLQLAGRSYVAKNPRATEMEVENFVRAISLAKEAPKQVQGDLFGFDDSAIRTAEMQAKKASAVMGRLRRDLSNINAAIRGEGKLVLSDEGATEYGIKDPNSKEQLQTAKTKIQNEIGKWEKWYVNPELVKQLTEAPPAKPAKEIAKGKAAEPGAKEPWEMTFDEHDKLSSKRYDELHVNDFGVTDDRNIKRKSSPGVYYHVVEPNYSGGDIYSYDEAVKKGLLTDERSARLKNEWRGKDFFKTTDAKNVSLFKTISEAIDHQNEYGGKILEINVPREIGTNAEGYAVARIIPKEWITKEIGSHKEIVKQALAEGKPVPADVLKDYPGLQKPKAGELAPRTEKTGAGEQVTIPRASAVETFSLVNPETEISKPLPQQVAPKNEEMFAREGGKAEATEDAGEELAYNKRNRIKSGIKWEDVKDKNTALKVKEVNKQNVYPKSDYQEMVDSGVNPMITHIVKQVYDVIPTKPALPKGISTDEALQLYITAVNRVMAGTIKWANDKNAILAWAKSQMKIVRAMSGQATDVTHLAGEPKTLRDIIYPDGYKNYIDEIRILGGKKLLAALQPGYRQTEKAIKEIEAGWPAPQEAWQRQGYSIISSEQIRDKYFIEKSHKDEAPYVFASIMYNDGSRSITIMQKAFDGAKSKDDPRVQDYIRTHLADLKGKFLLLDKRHRVKGKYDSLEEARESARELVKRTPGETISERGTSVEYAERTGAARREEGENITSDRLMKTFGFKGVNFGNWMKGDTNTTERQLHLNHAYDSLMDLAEIMNIPPEALSLNGMLGIAFGAQGSGKNVAHFIPGVNEINLTRTGGAGALAHEWAHALDHYFATQAGLEGSNRPYLTEHKGPFKSGLRPEIVDLFNKIITAMNKKTVGITPEEQIAQVATQKTEAWKRVDRWLRSIKRDFAMAGIDETAFDAQAERIKILDLGDGKISVSDVFFMSPVVSELRDLYKEKTGRTYSLDQIKGLQSNINHYEYLSEKETQEHVPQQREVSTDYAKEAADLDKRKSTAYWNTNVEKFARAFDAFITDAIEENAAKNTYLSGIEAAPPKGEERIAINKAFQDLVNEIKTKETDKGVMLYSVRQGAEVNMAGDISLADVQAAFRGQKVTQTKEGFLISTSAGNVLVESVDRIDANTYALNVGYGKERLTEGDVVAGRYRGGVITLKRGTADRFTLAHESIHFMEDIGVIGAGETKLLKNHIKNLVEAGKFETLNPEDIGGAEDRAEFLAGKLTQEPKGLLGRIIRNIQDFIDRIVNAFGIRTVKGIVRDIKTGKVFGSKVDTRAELAYNYVHEEVSDREREALRGDTRGQAGVQYQPTVVGREKIGVAKAASRTIRKPRDAAQIASQYLKRYPDEHLISMVMDKSGKLLHIYRHTVGLPGYTQVSVAIVAGEALNTPGAANIIVAHNHPSQRAELSAEDRAFTKSLEDTLRGSGVKLTDSLAVTSDSYSSHKETGGDLQTSLSGAAAGKVNIPILGRVFEVIHNGPKISNPESAKAQAKAFIPDGGILVMDGQNTIAGTVDISDFNKIRGNVQAELLKAFERRNGRNMIVYAPNRAIKPKEADNLSRFLRAARNEVKLLDIIDTTGSWADQGNLPSANVGDVDFYSYRAKADTFYSKLIKTVTGKIKEMPSKIQSIPKWLGRQNVKPAEMKWMGVEQWLKDNSKNGVIGKQAFADFLKSNQIEIREVTKGGNVGNILKRSQIRPHIENGETVFGYNDTTEEWDSVSNVKEANQYAEFSLTRPESGTKFHAYTIPGGENYRELLLMLPPPKRTIPSYEEWVGLEKMKQEDASVWDFAGDVKAEIDFSRARYEREKVPLHSEEAYRSDHWDEPNVLAHVRMNDRVDADGNRVLFLEEVQSDWHQEGKKKGYKQEVPDELQKRFDEAQKKRQQEQNKFYDLREVVGPNGPINEQRQIMAAAEREFEAINQERSKYTGGVPPAPFAENWHELLMKRMLRYAAENGYDKIAWTTGEIQAERYDLSKYIDRIEYEPAFVKGGSGKEMPSLYEFVAYGKDGKEIIHEDEIDLKRIEEIAGKEIAEKIRDDVGESMSKERPYRDWRKLSGLDLKVGGEGMKSFYDNLIPGFMNKYVKQWGAKVGLIDITAEGVNEYGESIDESVTPSREVSAHSVDITPAMKQDVLFNGQEYYSIRDSKAPPTTRDPKVVNEYIKDEADAIFQTIMNKLKPKSMTWLETMLKSPEWFDHPQINNIVRLFVRDRNEIYHQTFNDLNMADDIDATESTITEAGKALKGKGLSLVDRLAGKESAEYKMLSDFLDYFDTEAKRDPNKSDAENLADCEAYMRKNGATDDVVRVWRLYRQSYDKALDLQTRQLREMIDKVVEEATFRGESPEASLAELKSTLKYALAEMEKWRGYYAPRIREAGDWKVQAYKEHGPLEANREYYREHRASELSAQRLAKKLAREGWKITSIGRVEKLPESVYQDVKAVAAAKLIDKALERVEAHDTSLVGLNAEILRAVADEIKARGFRSHMIHRKGGAVIKGYIEDPLTRHLLYINQLSGGISKSVVAQRAMKELLGEKIMGKQIGGIDPVADPRAYSVATNYIQEQLRNMDATDRVIGLAKSVATFKFLGFNLRSLTVNMTALLTTTPTSIHQYATGGKGNMTTILKSLVSAGKDFGSFMAGRKLASAEEQAFLEEIHKKGWDDAQYTRDALGTIQRTHSRAWSEAMSASMYLFGVSEKFNRGTTLLSAYRMARKQGHSAEEAAEMAKTASDNAHGTYGRATLPMWAQGPNPAAKIGQMLYVYAKFPHNYLQMLYDVGFKKHNVKGALFAFLSPIVLAGVAALPFKDVIFAFAGFLLRAIGDDERDPEKWVWDNVRKHLGEGAERAGRHGITGALGVDLSGSLSIGVGVPKGLMDLTGAIGGVIEDVGAFGQGIATKQYSKAAESILPTGLGNPLRAYRESKEGVSTRDNRPVWDESGRQLVPTGGEAATKALGFRSTRQAVLSERTWEARRQRASFNEKRSQIYRKYRAWILSGRDKERYREIVKEVQKYNRDLHRLGLEREIAPITSQSLKSQSGRMQAPSKRDRAMLENRY